MAAGKLLDEVGEMREKLVQLAFDWGAAGAAQPGPSEGSEPSSASDRTGTLAQGLMEAVVAVGNMRQAYKRVRANKGSPGVDGMTVGELPGYLKGAWPRLQQELLDGTYKPQPVKRVSIPKPDGGVRELGIPTVVDRLIQQALLQVLTPLYDPTFSSHSYGFRPHRSAHQAVAQAQLQAELTKSQVQIRISENTGDAELAKPRKVAETTVDWPSISTNRST